MRDLLEPGRRGPDVIQGEVPGADGCLLGPVVRWPVLPLIAAIEGAGPFGPAERTMGGYLSLPASWRDQPETAADWIGKALSNGRTFPPKKKQPKKG